MPIRKPGFNKDQAGASLLEVLISMVVLAVGILGIGAMQAATMKSNQNSYMRTQAVFHAMDIVERMGANQAGVTGGNYNDPTPAQKAECLQAAGCTAAQMAAHDVYEWETSVAGNLPLGAATVCLDSTPDDGTSTSPACDSMGATYAVKIFWDDDRDGAVDQRYVMTFQP